MQFERQVCRLTCFCVEIPFPEQNGHVHSHREKLHVLQFEDTNVNNLIKMVWDSFRFLQRRKDSKTWFIKRFWKFQNLLYLTQKWIYKIPKKDRYKKVREDKIRTRDPQIVCLLFNRLSYADSYQQQTFTWEKKLWYFWQ